MALAADESKTVAKDARMAAIITAVRAEEAKYRDIELRRQDHESQGRSAGP